jgi:hypothetical protein
MRPRIPITVPTISALLKLLPFDEFEELVAVLEGGELEVGDGDFDDMKVEMKAVGFQVPEVEPAGVVLTGAENSDGDNGFDVEVGDESEVPVCCSAPKQPEGRRVNTVLTVPQLSAKIAP